VQVNPVSEVRINEAMLPKLLRINSLLAPIISLHNYRFELRE